MKYFCILMLILQSCTSGAQSDNGIRLLTFEDVSTISKDSTIQLIDVRTIDEYQKGYIGNARLIDFRDKERFEEECMLLNPSAPVYLYCHSGVRSRKAAQILLKMGFSQIFDYKGGYKEWFAKIRDSLPKRNE